MRVLSSQTALWFFWLTVFCRLQTARDKQESGPVQVGGKPECLSPSLSLCAQKAVQRLLVEKPKPHSNVSNRGYPWPLSHPSPLLPKDWHFLALPQANCGRISKFLGKQREVKALFPGVARTGCPLRLKCQALPSKEHLLQLSQPQLFWELAPLLNLEEILLPYREGKHFFPPSFFSRFVWTQSCHFFLNKWYS